MTILGDHREKKKEGRRTGRTSATGGNASSGVPSARGEQVAGAVVDGALVDQDAAGIAATSEGSGTSGTGA